MSSALPTHAHAYDAAQWRRLNGTPAEVAPPRPVAQSLTARFSSAIKLRKLLTKQLEKLPKDNTSGVDISQFEAIDSILDK